MTYLIYNTYITYTIIYITIQGYEQMAQTKGR
jgi:hypothetical protein